MRQPQVQTKSVQSIVIESNNWNLSPVFQRDSVFSKKQKSALIETILDNFPIGGSIFLVPTVDDEINDYDILDGKQRITTLREFTQNEFTFKPINVEKYASLKGKYFNEFPKEMTRRIMSFELPIVILDTEMATEENVKLMFKRINTTGVPLNYAEMRSSMGTKIGQAIKSIIDSYNGKEPGRLAEVILKAAKEKRMKDEDSIAILLSRYYYTVKNLRMDMSGKEYPDSFYEEDFTDGEIDEFKTGTLKIFKELTKYLSKPFVTLAEFDGIFSVMMHHSISWNKIKEQSDEFNKKLQQIYDDIHDADTVLIGGGHSHGSKAIYERYRIARSHLAPYIIEKDKRRYYTRAEREKIWAENPHICAICGEEIEFLEEMDVDHIIPHNAGGQTTLDNAQMTCIHCNRSKQDKL